MNKARMPFCTRRNSHVAHVGDLLDVQIEDIVFRHNANWSVVEVEVHGTELGLVEGTHFALIGNSEVLAVVVVEQSEVEVVLRMAGGHYHGQESLSGLLEEVVHALGVARECTVGMPVDTLPTGGAGDQDTVPVRRGYHYESVLDTGREIVQQLGQGEHIHPQPHHRNHHQTSLPVFSCARHVECGLGNLAQRRSGSELCFRPDPGTSSHCRR